MLTKVKQYGRSLVQNPNMQLAGLVLGSLAFAVTDAHAGTGGAKTFGTLEKRVIGWAEGALGVIIAVAALLIGLAMGIMRQSAAAVVIGVVIALSLYFGPTIIESVLTAVGGMGAVHPVLATAAAHMAVLAPAA